MADVANMFNYQVVPLGESRKLSDIRLAASVLAQRILDGCPEGADRDQAITYLRSAIHFAQDSILIGSSHGPD